MSEEIKACSCTCCEHSHSFQLRSADLIARAETIIREDVEAELARLREPVGEIRIGGNTIQRWREYGRSIASEEFWECLDLIERQQVEMKSLQEMLNTIEVVMEMAQDFGIRNILPTMFAERWASAKSDLGKVLDQCGREF